MSFKMYTQQQFTAHVRQNIKGSPIADEKNM